MTTDHDLHILPADPPDCCEYDECHCAEHDQAAQKDALLERGDARRKGDEYA